MSASTRLTTTTAMIALLLITALLGGATATPSKPATRGTAAWTYGCSEWDLGGTYKLFDAYDNNLANIGFDNAIASVYQTGMWLYYENVEFNQQAGRVYWVHGIEITVNFPNDNARMASSLKYVGSQDHMDLDTWTVYEGAIFTGSEYYGEGDSQDLGPITYEASSFILTGRSAWTFYEGTNYSGHAVCVEPNTDHDVGANGEVLNYGIFTSVTNVGLADNRVGSVRKGCWSENVAKGVPLQALHRSSNGAWGVIEP